MKLRHSVKPMGPKSTEVDEIDDVYKEEDPIEASVNIRKSSGKGAS